MYDFEEGDIRFYCREIEIEEVVNREMIKKKEEGALAYHGD